MKGKHFNTKKMRNAILMKMNIMHKQSLLLYML